MCTSASAKVPHVCCEFLQIQHSAAGRASDRHMRSGSRNREWGGGGECWRSLVGVHVVPRGAEFRKARGFMGIVVSWLAANAHVFLNAYWDSLGLIPLTRNGTNNLLP